MTIKRLLFIPLFLFSALLCIGQSQEVVVDYDYFLLGSLSDYGGREKYKSIIDKVDEYRSGGESFALFLNSIFKDEYKDLEITKKNDRLTLRSNELTEKLNSYYTFEPSKGKRGVYTGKESLMTVNLDSLFKTDDFLTKYFDTVYVGKIKDDIFKNDIERLSFITGAYLRAGRKNDSIYFVQLPNSVSKASELAEQLKNVNCTNVEYIVLKDYIPSSHTVYFTPTDILKEYFNVVKQKMAMFSEQENIDKEHAKQHNIN